MRIKVNGSTAVLKSGMSFDYVAENRLFSGSDGYTLSIDFPIAGCPQNLAIFGHITRRDIAINKIRFDCEIHDRGVTLSGTLTITKITESAVTGQFLEGRSAQNFEDSFDNIYLNELDLGAPDSTSTSDVAPAKAWSPLSLSPVALPWVNDSNDGAANNFAEYVNGAWVWATDTKGLSYFPYMLTLVKRLCDEIHYSYDFSAWDRSQWRYLLVCNALPYSWGIPEFARVLPHWSLTDFFEKLELLMAGEFDIDHRTQSITFRFTSDVLAEAPTTKINRVVDTFSSDVSADEHSADYIGSQNLKYKDPGYDAWNFLSCDWFIRNQKAIHDGGNIESYATFSDLVSALKKNSTIVARSYEVSSKKIPLEKLYYAKDLDAYFMIKITAVSAEIESKIYNYTWTTRLIPVNIFGPLVVDDSDDADEREIELLPVRIDDVDDDHGVAMFLSPSSYDDSDAAAETESDATTVDDVPIVQSHVYQRLEKGESDKAEYYSSISVAFWTGISATAPKFPVPHTMPVQVFSDWSYINLPFSLRLASGDIAARPYPQINPKIKYTFSFLSSQIPNVRGIFQICGQRYVCAKITATFSEAGMSPLLKGEFYQLA